MVYIQICSFLSCGFEFLHCVLRLNEYVTKFEPHYTNEQISIVNLDAINR